MKKHLLAIILATTAAPVFAASIDIRNDYKCRVRYYFEDDTSKKAGERRTFKPIRVGKYHYINKGDTHKNINVPVRGRYLRVETGKNGCNWKACNKIIASSDCKHERIGMVSCTALNKMINISEAPMLGLTLKCILPREKK